jgi:hypothetical protein
LCLWPQKSIYSCRFNQCHILAISIIYVNQKCSTWFLLRWLHRKTWVLSPVLPKKDRNRHLGLIE